MEKDLLEKQLEAVAKEGADKGREIASQDDFMTVYIDSAVGSTLLLDKAMEAADLAAEAYYKSNPRSAVGRMFISGGKAHFINEGKESLAIACSVPASCSERASAKEWLAAVLGACGGEALDAGGDDKSAKGKAICLPSPGGDFKTPSGKTFSRAEALGFEATAASVEWLRSKGLFPAKEVEGDDDDDFIPEW